MIFKDKELFARISILEKRIKMLECEHDYVLDEPKGRYYFILHDYIYSKTCHKCSHTQEISVDEYEKAKIKECQDTIKRIKSNKEKQ